MCADANDKYMITEEAIWSEYMTKTQAASSRLRRVRQHCLFLQLQQPSHKLEAVACCSCRLFVFKFLHRVSLTHHDILELQINRPTDSLAFHFRLEIAY